jgi:hypothetical protein
MTSLEINALVGLICILAIAGILVYYRVSSSRRIRAYYARQGDRVGTEQAKYASSDERRFLDEDEREARRGSREAERRHRDES